ncbi:MAG: dTDP-4-dehydrorhamnose 3,5-epimerase family protein [Candidatus Hadarchaeum sp.]
MIDGVSTKKLRKISDERGWLMEIMRSDWDLFEKFGQVYITTAYPDVVKAWHMHKCQKDNLACIKGKVKLVLYDGRVGSRTKGEINEFTLDEENPMLVKIPEEIWHGFKAMGQEMAMVINVPTALYNYEKPDEYRLPPDTKDIPYDWKLKRGLKHG